MVELVAQSPFAGMEPVQIGAVTLSEVDLGVLSVIAPFKGQNTALSRTLKEAHGMAAPGPNRTTGKEGARAIWFGHRMILLAGPEPDATLGEYAAITDQSDGCACVRLEGEGAEGVLARLTPIDLRAGVFKRGHTARTELQHMPTSITRVSPRGFLILTFRSHADTLRHDIETAMRGVAARGGD